MWPIVSNGGFTAGFLCPALVVLPTAMRVSGVAGVKLSGLTFSGE